MRRRLPIRVESPCDERWGEMAPTSEGRHCQRCASTVIDLTRVTRSQAERIVTAHGGKVCGRVRANARGEAVFAPEPVRAGMMPVALAGLLAACASEPSAEPTEPEPTHHVSPLEPTHDLGLDAPHATQFGGSMATGVMMPVGSSAPPPRPVVAQVQPFDERSDDPSDEQRALTRRKHQRQTQHSYLPPDHRPLMGGISFRP